jgi:hypothetical protein
MQEDGAFRQRIRPFEKGDERCKTDCECWEEDVPPYDPRELDAG